jgi:homoserine kinase type II
MPSVIESRVPVLEMLWEAQDPRHALAGRFGFSDGESAGCWVAAMLDEHWDIRVDRCERIVMSGGNALAWVGTTSGRLLAKWSVEPERFPRLAETARLTSWLHDRGLPVSAPLPARDGRHQVEVDRVSMNVQREIVGDLLDTAVPHQVHSAGAALARVQEALAAYPDADRIPALAAASSPLTARIIDWLDTRAGHLPVAARDTLRGCSRALHPTSRLGNSSTSISAPPTSCVPTVRSPRSSTSRTPGMTTGSSSWPARRS